MKTNKIEEEIIENGNRKINIGVRAYCELKLKLTDEAKALGISLSEYCENILNNHGGLLDSFKLLNTEVENLMQKNALLEKSLSKADLPDSAVKIEQLIKENSHLKKEIIELKSIQEIFSDPRLSFLFKKVKGLTDTIITDKGELNITFNSPKDVLLALIYSFKI